MCLCINSLSTLRATIQIHPFLRQKTKNILLSSPSKHILITTKQIFEPKWNHFGQTHFCFSSSAMSTARNIREPHYPSKKKQRPIIATTKTISDGSVGGWLCERWGNGEMGVGERPSARHLSANDSQLCSSYIKPKHVPYTPTNNAVHIF